MRRSPQWLRASPGDSIDLGDRELNHPTVSREQRTDWVIWVDNQHGTNPLAFPPCSDKGILEFLHHLWRKSLLRLCIGIDYANPGLDAIVKLEAAIHRPTDEDCISGIGQALCKNVPQCCRIGANYDVVRVDRLTWVKVSAKVISQTLAEAACNGWMGYVRDGVFAEGHLNKFKH